MLKFTMSPPLSEISPRSISPAVDGGDASATGRGHARGGAAVLVVEANGHDDDGSRDRRRLRGLLGALCASGPGRGRSRIDVDDGEDVDRCDPAQ
jgi:hypothetical protein